MNTTTHPKAVIFLEDQTICQSVKDVLTNSGWDITCQRTVAEVLQAFENNASDPYPLFISGLEASDMDPGKLYGKVETQSPATRRMVIAAATEKEALIHAVNTGRIHACVPFPFQEENLIFQAKTCYENYRKAQKRQRLIRLITRQNQQLYETAKRLKQKERDTKRLVGKKKASLTVLNAQNQQEDKQSLTAGISLEKLIHHKKTALEPNAFLEEFLTVTLEVNELVEKMVTAVSAEWETPGLKKLLQTGAEPFDPAGLVETVKKQALIHALAADATSERPEFIIEEETIENYIGLSISEDQLTARLTRKKTFSDDLVNLNSILEYLRLHHINYGIADDDVIKEWLNGKEPRIIIARGESPVPSKDGSIEYFFQTDYTNPGKILEDGSIDFKDRGDVPYVEKGKLLAKKTPAVKGAAGIDIFGTEIFVKEAIDPVIASGSGTKFSDDKLSVFADGSGQPHTDAMGTITVNQEIVIKGDVGYETGNVHFDGNIVVRGTVKNGFSVKGITLTANAIEGATIELTGELNVSNGITNATIITVGNIHTKFINNCSILGFGNFTVLKEIIDSNILLGGHCNVSTGHMIASTVSAKGGIEAGNIGTVFSNPPDLRVGFDDHIGKIEKDNQAKLERSLDRITMLKRKIEKLEEKDRELRQDISGQAFIQDRSMVEIRQCKKQIPELAASGNTGSLHRVTASLESLKKNVSDAEIVKKKLVKNLDTVEAEMAELKNRIHVAEEKNARHVNKKKKLRECKRKTKPDPVVRVRKTIVQGTRITAPNSFLVLKEDQSRCMFQEIKQEESNGLFYKIHTSPYT